jgi:aminomethyltransferase
MKTALYDRHVALGAKIVDFEGWEMPIQYQKGITHEHETVRRAVGIFDVSHMGRVMVTGKESEAFLDYLSTNKIAEKKDGTATYTVWMNSSGGAVDDVIVYRSGSEEFFVVVNASNRESDLAHMRSVASDFNVTITPRFDEDGIIAIQGPRSVAILEELFPTIASLRPMRFITGAFQNSEVIIARTGYTGSLGFEVYGPASLVLNLWNKLIERGAEPIGLGARDTLRLEMGYALYGHELSATISPLESVSAWTVKTAKARFLGKESLGKEKRSQYGVVMLDGGIPRHGYEVLQGDRLIGIVTSGTFSPCLKKGIAIVLLDEPMQIGETLFIRVRKKLLRAQITKLPFIDPKEEER